MLMPIPADWDGVACCRWVVYWPDSPKWVAILHGLLDNPSKGRFWDESSGSILDTQSAFRPFYDKNFDLEEVFMSCNDSEMVAAFQAIATALNKMAIANQQLVTVNANCCTAGGGGSAGGGAAQPPFSPNEEGTPGVDPPPEGWDTWEEFFNDKCAVAHIIVNKLQNDLGNLTIVSIGALTVEELVELMVTFLTLTLPVAALIAIASLLIKIGSVIVVASALSIINDNEEDFVCALFNGTNASDSAADFLSKFNELADSAIADPVERFAAETVIDYFVDASVTNELYTKNSAVSYPESDCSACTCELFHDSKGEDITKDFTTWTATGEFVSAGRYDVEVFFHMPEWTIPCGAPVEIASIEVLSGAITGPGGSFLICRTYDGAGSTTYSSNSTIVETPVTTQAITLTSSEVFTVRITINP